MRTRTVTRTFVLVAVMLNLGVAGAYAQKQRRVKMTFSGTNVATTINLQANTVTDETHLRAEVRLGHSRFVNSTQTGPCLNPPPAAWVRISECWPARAFFNSRTEVC